MNRAAAWRLHAPAVRYDYAPRSWDHQSRPCLGDLGKREHLWPIARKLLKLATVCLLGLVIVYTGMNFRIRYLGGGTVQFERLAISGDGTAVLTPSLSTVGVVMGTHSAAQSRGPSVAPAPAPRPATIDTAPPAAKASEADVCKQARQTMASAVASYNRKYPSTRVHSLVMASLLEGELKGAQPACPKHGEFTLTVTGEVPAVHCSVHPN